MTLLSGLVRVMGSSPLDRRELRFLASVFDYERNPAANKNELAGLPSALTAGLSTLPKVRKCTSGRGLDATCQVHSFLSYDVLNDLYRWIHAIVMDPPTVIRASPRKTTALLLVCVFDPDIKELFFQYAANFPLHHAVAPFGESSVTNDSSRLWLYPFVRSSIQPPQPQHSKSL
jgi:hypothetical protein